ncbi:hypothetical protein GLOTRDRAFT_137974 [Gloeophyllum trabeum ATCC 11539]|uniref:NAD(P)-binding domain-containing protein n=1 Tax=Gloeophyllum trabeum (strain ATCC 11539 / FP-39264 / Madison 617) TaxID=670483 RepID=S7Q850_GLOTA|nr:uncharacterized protein GLOTRDRAFT_137974 [Gloeophyllum trabeum ATCC 11539]EPQ56161.1 hypothetical protein GLOTRDRAFT_137974 [Gloeophyllum trabeum ATCC 11539]
MAAAGRSALILGATGATGKHLLRELLSSSYYSRVGEYGRRVTPLDGLTSGKEKLEQKQIDFEKLEEAGLDAGKWDVVYITLGTTRAKAGSAAAFEKIDREYVVNAARLAKSNDPTHKQRLVYLSSGGANPSAPFLYPRSKGLTELALASLGYDDTIILRPGFLQNAQRGESRPVESVLVPVFSVISRFVSIAIDVSVLAKGMRVAGELGSAGLPKEVGATTEGKEGEKFTVIGNAGCIALAKSASS